MRSTNIFSNIFGDTKVSIKDSSMESLEVTASLQDYNFNSLTISIQNFLDVRVVESNLAIYTILNIQRYSKTY